MLIVVTDWSISKIEIYVMNMGKPSKASQFLIFKMTPSVLTSMRDLQGAFDYGVVQKIRCYSLHIKANRTSRRPYLNTCQLETFFWNWTSETHSRCWITVSVQRRRLQRWSTKDLLPRFATSCNHKRHLVVDSAPAACFYSDKCVVHDGEMPRRGGAAPTR